MRRKSETIGRNALCFLLKNRAFGHPVTSFQENGTFGSRINSNFLEVGTDNKRFVPTLQWEEIEKAYPKYPSVKDLRISHSDRECFVDMRPFVNQSPLTVHEGSSVAVSSNNFSIYSSMYVMYTANIIIISYIFFPNLSIMSLSANVSTISKCGHKVFASCQPVQPSCGDDHSI